jgi:DNA polymerase V
MYALVDGNNFYVSCERAFRPMLLGKPVIVLSNNDGCAIARSNEAKALGIRMGHPWFQVQSEFKDAGVVALSANFTLYGDMSNRMMGIAAGLGPTQEIYSIDECFISLDGMRGDMTARAEHMRGRILQWTGIPTGIGIGTTKTLAKLANHVAKSADRKPGSYPAALARVCNLAQLDRTAFEAVLDSTDVGEVWGVGRRIAEQLRALQVNTVLDLSRLDAATVRRRWSVVLERTVRELQGQPCIALETIAPNKQEIACTRSFGQPITTLPALIEAVSEFASRAGEKLRKQGSAAGQVLVFLHTSPFRLEDKQFSQSITVPLRRPTNSTNALAAAASAGMRAIYKPGYKFAKAGVMLLDLQANDLGQAGLAFDNTPSQDTALMASLDAINDRYGKGTLRVASAGVQDRKRAFEMRQERRTPHYTTSWSDLPQAYA